MSGQQYLNAITENATRFGMRLQESFSEHTRDLALTRGVSAAYLDNLDDRTKNIRKQLDSNSGREKLDAMKRLIALISKGRDVSEYFAQVVKNVASQNLEIRKLVYIYLLRYAEQEPDLALLSINTFQKDLTDSNPLIRAMALRVLSGIRVPMIGNIVVLAIKKCAADISPYVRKTAGLAIPRCNELDSSHLSSLIQIIASMLKERSPLAIGSVAVAFDAVCPTRLDLLHQQYRRLCRMLPDADEWGQADLMNLLLRYARTMLPRPTGDELDPDVMLLLTSVEPILMSCNPASVTAAARVIFYAGPPAYLQKIVQPFLRLLHNSREVERVVLAYLLVIAQKSPELLSPHHTHFFLRTNDAHKVKRDKIQLLLRILNPDNYGAILREFIDYSDDIDDCVVNDSLHAIGCCAFAIPESTQQCLTALINMIQSGNDSVTSPAVMVLKNLVQNQLSSTVQGMADTSRETSLSIIARLSRKIDEINNTQARACVIWLVGQYAASNGPTTGPEGISEWAPDVLRKAARTFQQEAVLVKLQIVTLAAKLLILSPEDRTLTLLSQYVFSLARYDTSYDVRDRAKMITSLLSGALPSLLSFSQEERGGVVLRREQVLLVLFEGKSGVVMEKSRFEDGNALIGSLSVVLGRPMPMDNLLPDWLEKGVEPSLRDSEDDKPIVPVVTAISSTSTGQRSKTMTMPVILTPMSTSRPSSRQENTRGVIAQDLESFYADAIDSEEEESEEDEQSQDDEHHDEDEDEDEGEGEGDDSDGETEGAGGSSESDDEAKEESASDDEAQARNVNLVIPR